MSRQTVLALAAGTLPDGVKADSAKGRMYAAIIEDLNRYRSEAERYPPTDEQIARVVELLRSA